MKIIEAADFVTVNLCATIADAQRALGPTNRVVEPNPESAHICEELNDPYRGLYFGFGKPDSPAVSAERILPTLRRIAAGSRGNG
ncbi:MAG: hypothetical protein WBE13_21335 [Candidatus Acidiferrum sp.]